MGRTLLITILFLGISECLVARSLYLNGTDISSARGQELKNVTIQINEKGDIFIIAPHYQVNEEDTFVPLSKYVQGMTLPVHKKPAEQLPGVTSNSQEAEGQIPKAGDPIPVQKPSESKENAEKNEKQ